MICFLPLSAAPGAVSWNLGLSAGVNQLMLEFLCRLQIYPRAVI